MEHHIPFDPLETPRHDGVVTLWFVTTANPAQVIENAPRADRGFGRKLLAQMNPRWPITAIGQFSLNRSAKVSEKEFYIAGYPGVAVVQTCLEDVTKLSAIDPKLRTCVPAADVYIFAENRERGIGGFAHFSGDTLKRSFVARRERVYEDHGLPLPFEGPFWAGERAEQSGGINLPFWPLDLMEEAQRGWLGFDPKESNDIHVAAFAIDGRPEPKVATPTKPKDVSTLAQDASAKLGLGELRRDYDDYESASDEEAPLGQELVAYAQRGAHLFKRVSRAAIVQARAAKDWISHTIRHTDR